MNRYWQNRINRYVVFLIPVLGLFYGVYILMTAQPSYAFASDPEYPYLINGLNCALFEFGRVGHTDHPGTPFQIFSGIVIRLTHLLIGKGDLTKDVLSRPETYLTSISLVLTILQSVLLWVVGRVALSRLKMKHVLLFQLTPFLHTVLINLAGRINPDRFFIIVSLLFLIVYLKYALNNEDSRLKFVVWSSVVMGLGLATKLNYLPILVLPLFIMQKWKHRFMYSGFTLLSFTFFIAPVLPKFPAFREFILNLVQHDGLYGAGESRVFNFSKIYGNIIQIFTINPELIVILLSVLVVVSYCILKNNVLQKGIHSVSSSQTHPQNLRLYIGFLIVFLLQLIIVSKHYKNYYLVPFFTIYGLILYVISISSEDWKRKWLRYIFQFVVPVILLFISITGSIKTLTVRKNERFKAIEEQRLFISNNLSENDYWMVEPTWEAAPFVENALVYGLSYCTRRIEYEQVLSTINPLVITYSVGEKTIRKWKCSVAEIDTVLVAGRKINIFDTPGRNAESLMNFLKENSQDLGLSIVFDTVFSQSSTQSSIIQATVQDGANTISDLRLQMKSAFEVDTRTAYQRKIDHYIQEIKLSDEWLAAVQKKAEERNIPLDSMIYLDAVYMVENE